MSTRSRNNYGAEKTINKINVVTLINLKLPNDKELNNSSKLLEPIDNSIFIPLIGNSTFIFIYHLYLYFRLKTAYLNGNDIIIQLLMSY